jgi:tetratricopeptide (TPR) repeat protein
MPDFSEAYFYLGLAYDKNNNFANAEKVLLRAIELNPDNSRAMNYLGYAYADKGIKLNDSEAFLVRAVSLDPKNATYLDSLGWLYYKQKKFDIAEKLLVSAVNLTRNSIIYEHLGDTYSALNKAKEAWTAYALSYDFKQDKGVRKKLNIVQATISKEELYKQMLLRSQGNYLRLFSFKTGYKVKLNSGLFGKNIYVPFLYIKNSDIKIKLPATVVAGDIEVSIKNGMAEISPKAVEKKIHHILLDVISLVCKIFNNDFYKQFIDAEAVLEGKHITYSKNGLRLTLNMNTGLIEKISQDNVSIQILKYDTLFVSKIPSKIKLHFCDEKVKGTLEAVKISFMAEPSNVEKNENKSKSTGKD